jgi:tetratricopeptide (TPR) repeat protein
MSEFDRIFDPQYTATELFTNRIDEHTAFTTALLQHTEGVRGGSATLGHTARRNVITFYGVGGIGKTELSRRLESWCVGELAEPGDWARLPPDQLLATVRIDFHGSRVVNAVDIMLRLRVAVAGRRRRFPAFDLGLAAWWALARPGTPLPDLSASSFDVRGQITDTLNDVLSDVGAGFGLGPLTVRSGIRIVDAVREKRLRSHTLGECAPLLHVITQAQQDPSDYVAATLAGLLSWDLENLPAAKRPVTVAFADAAEYVQGEDRSQERLFNRIVHLTPGTLWVVTSRNRLDWDAAHVHQLLPATGPHIWPGLRLEAQEDPRQHLVGNLSELDVKQYLRAASGTAGNPELTPDVIDNISAGAHGLPLYLSLSLSMARAAHGDPPAAQAFGGPLPELATRVFANLPQQERELARAASLLPRFDERLISQAAGALVGDAQRLCQRTLVTKDDHPVFPYRLHDAVRSAIAHEPVSNPGAWAPDDRTAMAKQLLEALRHRSDALLLNSGQRLDVMELAADLCARHALTAPWLADALAAVPGFAKTADRLPPPTLDTWVGQVSGIYEAWRHGRRKSERIAYLEDYLSQPLHSGIRHRARLRLAYVYRDGDPDNALRILKEMLEENPASGLLRYQVARTLRTRGEYEELERHMSRYPMQDPTTSVRITSDLAFDRGLLEEAIAGSATRAQALRARGQHRVALENEASALWRRALYGRSTPAECDALLADADHFGETLPMRTALTAKAISMRDDQHAALELLTETQRLVEAREHRTGWREWTGRLVVALCHDDRASTVELHRTWLATDRHWSPNYQVLDRLFVFAGCPARYRTGQITTAESASVADQRWHTIFESLMPG